MRVCLDEEYKETAAGPSMFLSRLIKELKLSYNVEFTSHKPHVSLGVITKSGCKKGRQVVRIDGCYYNLANTGGKSLNKCIAHSIRSADGIIYQSKFSKLLCERLLQVKPKRSTVICNGIDQKWISEIKPSLMEHKYTFLSIARWRNSKRPKSIINGFLESNIDDSQLLFIGKYKEQFDHPKIKFLGNKTSEEIISILKASTALIHLCKIESCPNVVIEALSCGLPIVCNNIGGTPELVKSDGIVIKSDSPFAFDFIKESDVDNIDTRIISNGLIECISRNWNISRPDLDISRTAKEYYNFFLKVLHV